MLKLRFRDNRGAALVELALTMPLLLLITIGAAELGRIAYFAIEVESSARAGSSFGAVNINNAVQTATIEQAALNDAPNLPSMVATASNQCVCETLDTSTNVPSYNPTSGTVSCTNSAVTAPNCTTVNTTEAQYVISYVVVSTTATVSTMFHYPGIPSSFTLNGYSETRVLQN